jgi:hypothetical protein
MLALGTCWSRKALSTKVTKAPVSSVTATAKLSSANLILALRLCYLLYLSIGCEDCFLAKYIQRMFYKNSVLLTSLVTLASTGLVLGPLVRALLIRSIKPTCFLC